MASLIFVVTHSTDDPDRTIAALRTARAAAEAGHDVALWCMAEGVRLGVRHVAETLREDGEPVAARDLEALVGRGARLWVSRPCFAAREFEEDALREGAGLADARKLADLIADGRAAVPT